MPVRPHGARELGKVLRANPPPFRGGVIVILAGADAARMRKRVWITRTWKGEVPYERRLPLLVLPPGRDPALFDWRDCLDREALVIWEPAPDAAQERAFARRLLERGARRVEYLYAQDPVAYQRRTDG